VILDCEHLRILRCRLDPLDNLIEAFVGMMQEHVLTSQALRKNPHAAAMPGSRAG
jgi:hypothetical protein